MRGRIIKIFNFVLLFVAISYFGMTKVNAEVVVDSESGTVTVTGNETFSSSTYNGTDISNMHVYVGTASETGNLTISDGTYGVKGEFVEGGVTLINGEITVNGGTFNSLYPADVMGNSQGGTLTINGGTFNMPLAVNICGGISDVVINGGTFKTNGWAAIDAAEISTGSLIINGGTFENTANNEYSPALMISNESIEKVTIKGGTFKAKSAAIAYYSPSKTTSSEIVSKLLASGFTFDNNTFSEKVYEAEPEFGSPESYSYNSASSVKVSEGSTKTPVSKVEYEMLDGAEQIYDAKADGTATFRAAGALEDFSLVKMDGVVVDSSNYTTASGSTIITFKKSFMQSLTNGNHTLEIVYKDGGVATTSFTVKNSIVNPNTVDNIMIYILMLIVSMLGLSLGYKFRKNN